MIVGIDEVGRGAWAGPLVVGAVALGGVQIDGLTDSKLVPKKMRSKLSREIRYNASAIGIGWVGARVIDSVGLTQSLRLATKIALDTITIDYDEIVIDGSICFSDDPRANAMPKADLLIPSVSAASIIAKVARDNYMSRVALAYPEYSFGSHVGYGTKAHRQSLMDHGITPLHRMSFEPIRQLKGGYIHTVEPSIPKYVTKNKSIGNLAEDAAVTYLQDIGHVILDRNWRTKWCEIDIISLHNNSLHFTEVKYRATSNFGDGIAAITSKKYQHLRFAAEVWLSNNNHQKGAFQSFFISLIAVSGHPPLVARWLPNI